MPPKFRYPAAIIVWDDAHARGPAMEFEENEVAELHRPEVCQILGLVIRDDETGVSMYCEETSPSSIRGLSFVPRAMIKSITYVNLTPVKARKPRRKAALTPPLSEP